MIDVLGLNEEKLTGSEAFLRIVLEFYKEAKSKKEYDKVDHIRELLKDHGVVLKDVKEKIDWAYEE